MMPWYESIMTHDAYHGLSGKQQRVLEGFHDSVEGYGFDANTVQSFYSAIKTSGWYTELPQSWRGNSFQAFFNDLRHFGLTKNLGLCSSDVSGYVREARRFFRHETGKHKN